MNAQTTTPVKPASALEPSSFRGPAVMAVVAAASLLAGCGKAPGGAPGGPMGATPEVAVLTVAPQRVTLTTELPGRTSPYRIAEIRPQVSGLIQKRLFVEGADVKAGEVLYQIDPAPFQAALDNAQAALGRAEANLPSIRSRARRFEELLADKAVSQQDCDDAASAVRQAEADIQYWKATVQTARINLDYTRITSPISGRIGKSSVTDGAIVTAYQPVALAAVQQLDPIYVDVPQSTSEQLRLQRRLADGRLAPGGTNAEAVQLVLEDGTPYPLKGTFQFRDVSVDPTTASVILRMVFPNTNHTLLPGMFVRALVQEGVNEAAILIPQQAAARNPKGDPYVLLVDTEGKVEQRPVTLERTLGDQWLVSKGLSAGERVIAEGLQKARPGTLVKAVRLADAKEPAPTPPAAARKP